MLKKYVQFFEDNRDALTKCVIKIKKYRNIHYSESFDEKKEKDASILYELIDNIYNNIPMKELAYTSIFNDNNDNDDNNSVQSDSTIDDNTSSDDLTTLYNTMMERYDINVVKNIIKAFTQKYGPNWKKTLQNMSEEEKRYNCYYYSFQYDYYKKVLEYVDTQPSHHQHHQHHQLSSNSNSNINTYYI
jgi:hypothetical protein